MRKIFDFQVLGVSELRLKTDVSTATHIQLPGVNVGHMSTKSTNGGALLYIRDTINYKLRPNLNVENEKKLESIFIEILQKTSKHVITGCIYRHLCYASERIQYWLFKISNRKNLSKKITKK